MKAFTRSVVGVLFEVVHCHLQGCRLILQGIQEGAYSPVDWLPSTGVANEATLLRHVFSHRISKLDTP